MVKGMVVDQGGGARTYVGGKGCGSHCMLHTDNDI